MPYRLDTDTHVYFYENEFYPLSSFSAFRLTWRGFDFDTLEHAYHWEKFYRTDPRADSPQHIVLRRMIRDARSAHDAFQIAREHAACVREDWPEVKLPTMKTMQRAKAQQHEYVRRKLLQSFPRQLVEDSWRDNFWGSGPDGTGANWCGRLWEEIRAELLGLPADIMGAATPPARSEP